jgi:hypothetical protein
MFGAVEQEYHLISLGEAGETSQEWANAPVLEASVAGNPGATGDPQLGNEIRRNGQRQKPA